MADPRLSHSLSCNELLSCSCLCCISTLVGCSCDAQSLTTMLAHFITAASVAIAYCLLSNPLLLPHSTNGRNAAAVCRTGAAAAPAAAPAPAEPAVVAAESSAADETASDASYSADELPQTSAMPRQSSNLMHASKLPHPPAMFITSYALHDSSTTLKCLHDVYGTLLNRHIRMTYMCVT